MPGPLQRFLPPSLPSQADTQTSIADHSRMRGGRLTLPEQLAKKAHLGARRALAQKQKNEQELAQVGQELADLEAQYPALRAATEVVSDRTSTILEKNRLAALKERRENEEAERDARRRKALGAAAGGGGSSDVSRPGTPPVKDLSARVKTVSRLGQDADSRYVSCVSSLPPPSLKRPLQSVGYTEARGAGCSCSWRSFCDVQSQRRRQRHRY